MQLLGKKGENGQQLEISQHECQPPGSRHSQGRQRSRARKPRSLVREFKSTLKPWPASENQGQRRRETTVVFWLLCQASERWQYQLKLKAEFEDFTRPAVLDRKHTPSSGEPSFLGVAP